ESENHQGTTKFEECSHRGRTSIVSLAGSCRQELSKPYLPLSVRFSICFIQMPERRDRCELRSASARAKGDRHPFEWCNSQPASAVMSSKILTFPPIFAASFGR